MLPTLRKPASTCQLQRQVWPGLAPTVTKPAPAEHCMPPSEAASMTNCQLSLTLPANLALQPFFYCTQLQQLD